MFERLFAFIRQSLRDAIVGGVEDAQEELNQRIEASHTTNLEAEQPKRLNGTAKKKKARSK